MRLARLFLLIILSTSSMLIGAVFGGCIGILVNNREGSGIPIGIAAGLFSGIVLEFELVLSIVILVFI